MWFNERPTSGSTLLQPSRRKHCRGKNGCTLFDMYRVRAGIFNAFFFLVVKLLKQLKIHHGTKTQCADSCVFMAAYLQVD